MQVHYVKWKKFKTTNEIKPGWFTKDNYLEEEYDSVESVGYLIQETPNTIVLASSICKDLYNNITKIYRGDVIDSWEFVEEETKEEVKEIKEEQEEQAETEEERKRTWEDLVDIEVNLINLYNQGLPLLDIAKQTGFKYPAVRSLLDSYIKDGLIKKRQFYCGVPIFYDTKEDYYKQTHALMKEVKSIEEVKNIEPENMHPATKKIQEGTDWLAKYNIKEEELREVLKTFKTRKEAGEYLGIDPRIVSFMAIQIGERKMGYSRRPNMTKGRKEYISTFFIKHDPKVFLAEYYCLRNVDLCKKYDITNSILDKLIKRLKDYGYNVERKRVSKMKSDKALEMINKPKKLFINPKEKWFINK